MTPQQPFTVAPIDYGAHLRDYIRRHKIIPTSGSSFRRGKSAKEEEASSLYIELSLRDPWDRVTRPVFDEIFRESFIQYSRDKAETEKRLRAYSLSEKTKGKLHDPEVSRNFFLSRILFKVPGNPHRFFVVSVEDNKVQPVCEDVVLAVLPRGKESDQEANLYWSQSFVVGDCEYRPDLSDVVFTNESQSPVPIVNSYQRPEWRRKFERNPELMPGLDPLLIRFLKHLFPVQECLEYVLDWCAASLFSNNFCFLFMRGTKGTGKNLFFELLGRIHGESNIFTRSGKRAFSDFDGETRYATLGLFDEVSIETVDDYNHLKKYANKVKEVRAMFTQGARARNYASIVISLNPESKIHAIDPDDRRFSMPFLTSEPIMTVFTTAETERINDDENILEGFANFLMQRKVARDMRKPYRNAEKYIEMAGASLPEAMREFFEVLLKEDEKKEGSYIKRMEGAPYTAIISRAAVKAVVFKITTAAKVSRSASFKPVSSSRVFSFFRERPGLGFTKRSNDSAYPSIYMFVSIEGLLAGCDSNATNAEMEGDMYE